MTGFFRNNFQMEFQIMVHCAPRRGKAAYASLTLFQCWFSSWSWLDQVSRLSLRSIAMRLVSFVVARVSCQPVLFSCLHESVTRTIVD